MTAAGTEPAACANYISMAYLLFRARNGTYAAFAWLIDCDVMYGWCFLVVFTLNLFLSLLLTISFYFKTVVSILAIDLFIMQPFKGHCTESITA